MLLSFNLLHLTATLTCPQLVTYTIVRSMAAPLTLLAVVNTTKRNVARSHMLVEVQVPLQRCLLAPGGNLKPVGARKMGAAAGRL
jgi:hypothetical protein